MRLSDYKGEEALDVLADIIEPVTLILGDKEIQELAKEHKGPLIKFVKPMIKNHKREVLEILARLENEPVEKYKEKVNILTLPTAILELINDPEIQSLFHSQGQTQVTSLASSGSATENTEASEK